MECFFSYPSNYYQEKEPDYHIYFRVNFRNFAVIPLLTRLRVLMMTRLESKLAQTHVALTGPTRQQVLQLMMTRFVSFINTASCLASRSSNFNFYYLRSFNQITFFFLVNRLDEILISCIFMIFIVVLKIIIIMKTVIAGVCRN